MRSRQLFAIVCAGIMFVSLAAMGSAAVVDPGGTFADQHNTDDDAGDGKVKTDDNGSAADGGNGKAKMGDGGDGDDAADGGNGKAKAGDGGAVETTEEPATTTETTTEDTTTETEAETDADTETGTETTETVTETTTETTTTTTTETATETTAEPEGELAFSDVQKDAPNPELENLDQEYVQLTNTGNAALDLSGYTVDYGDSTNTEYTFESGFELGAGDTVTIRTGSGEDTDSNVYIGSDAAVLNNEEPEQVTVMDGNGNVVLQDTF